MKNEHSNLFIRILKSHIFRIFAECIVVFSTVFFPMFFAYPILDDNLKNILVVIIVFACIVEIIAFVLIVHFSIYSKARKAIGRLDSMAKGETYKFKLDNNSIDNTTSELISAVNTTSDEYARLDQNQKVFVSNASHELRSPLTSIQGFLQASLDGTLSKEERDKYLEIALSETKRLNSMINSMLDLSRLDSGKNPITPNKFDINDVIREIVTRFEPALIKKALQINVDFSREICYVFADKDKITQVVTNLIDNAIKYSPSYSRIIVTTSIHESKAYVTVRDYGYGISKKDQMLIWDSFYMTDKSHSPNKTTGSGLGLSIVKKIIDEHGEVIWVESSRGAGATFIFTLTLFDPLKHKPKVGTVIKMPNAEKSSTELSADTEGSDGTVL